MKKILLAFLVLGCIVSCKKSENPPTTYYDYTVKNIAGKYLVSGLTFKTYDSAIEYDVYNLDTVYKPCKKDDIIVFDTNSIFHYYDTSGLVCDSVFNEFDNRYTISNTNLISGIKTFEPHSEGYTTYVITSLTANQMILSKNRIVPFITGNINGNIKVTLTKIP